jgi:hypothetical protein
MLAGNENHIDGTTGWLGSLRDFLQETRAHDKYLNFHVNAAAVRGAVATYNWVCMPGTWLTYMLVIGIPFSATIVRPPHDGTRTQRPLPRS